MMVGMSVVCEQSSALDLSESLEAARAYDATWQAAQFAREAGLERKHQGRASLLPQIQISTSASRSKSESLEGEREAPSRSRRQSVGVGVSQVVFDWGKFVQWSMAKQRASIADDQALNAEQELILRVANQYFAVILAQDQLMFAQAAKAALSKQLAFAKKSFEVGTMTVVDQYEAQANFDHVVAQEMLAEHKLALARENFFQVTGREADQLSCFNISAPLISPEPDVEQDWLARADAQNYSLRIQEKQYWLAKRDIQTAYAEHLPSVSLRGNYGEDRSRTFAPFGGVSRSDSRSSSVMLDVSIPIFSGGAAMSMVREKGFLAEQARAELNATRRKVRQDTRAAFLGVNSGRAQVVARAKTVESLQKQLEATRLGREVGVRTSLDLLTAERQLLDARSNLSQARVDYLSAHLQLAALTASLNSERLQRLNAHFFQPCQEKKS